MNNQSTRSVVMVRRALGEIFVVLEWYCVDVYFAPIEHFTVGCSGNEASTITIAVAITITITIANLETAYSSS
jgi:hypothetical protein